MVLGRAARLGPRFVRWTGNNARGPAVDKIPSPQQLKEQFAIASEFFTTESLNYGDFKNKCEALRLFVFAGVVSGLAVHLMVFPLKSSYFYHAWSPTTLPKSLYSTFIGGTGSVFLEEPKKRSVDCVDVCEKLVLPTR